MLKKQIILFYTLGGFVDILLI